MDIVPTAAKTYFVRQCLIGEMSENSNRRVFRGPVLCKYSFASGGGLTQMSI
jgi:hypothetical protein